MCFGAETGKKMGWNLSLIHIFISKNNIRFIDQRPANRNSLFLTSRYFRNSFVDVYKRQVTMIVPPCLSTISLDRKSPIPVPLFSMTFLELPL